MSDIKDKLKGLLERGSLMQGSEWRKKTEELERRRLSGEFEIAKFVPGEVAGDEDSSFYLVRRDFPLDTMQGAVQLGAALNAIPEHIGLCSCDSELEEFDPATAIFIDAETTGLAGGTGTVAFLVGAGYFTEGVFRLDQCFMRDFDDEEAMLRYLDGVFANAETVVSFNGKSFDMPLLQTRFIANLVPFRLEAAAHFDLVHAARRLWKKRLGDCSLANIERHILRLRRHGDVPGSEIPEIWFKYLRTRDARQLPAVFRHHRDDVLSLVALTALLSQSLDAPEGEGFEHAQDRLSLVRLYFRQKRYDETITHANQLLETETEATVRGECIELLAFACKRTQDWERMEEAWALMLREFPSDIVPRLELAKHHEHRARNLPEAQRICEEAMQFLETRAALGRGDEFDTAQTRAFQHRLDRIRRKLSRARPQAP